MSSRQWAERLVFLPLICLVHAALLWGMTVTLARVPARISAPALVGLLVSPEPAVEPIPLPVAPRPEPQPVKPTPPTPQPVKRPPPPKPRPVPPPSVRAVTAPAPPKVMPAPAAALLPPAVPMPAARAPEAAVREPEPVLPPRSDASHLNNPAPAYPRLSRRLREQGRVLLDVYILPDGSVGELKIKESSGYRRLDEAAREAVRQWRYQPARQGNTPIPYWYVQPLDFVLKP